MTPVAAAAGSSAAYQRAYRQRLRERGLVKKEVWIRPEHAAQLAEIETTLREPADDDAPAPVERLQHNREPWRIEALLTALADHAFVRSGRASVARVDGVATIGQVTVHGCGDLPVYTSVAGEQVLVEALLWPANRVRDVAAFNDEALRTHKIFPLSTLSLDLLPDGRDYYAMFGALSAYSRLDNVVFEIETLADNCIKASEAWADHLAPSAVLS